MKIFTVDFEPMYPVPSGLIIAAKDRSEAFDIASRTISHTTEFSIKEIDISQSKVIFYESGDY